VIPLSDGIPARRFPIVNVALIAANFAVWIFYGDDAASREAADARVSTLSAALAAVLGAYLVLSLSPVARARARRASACRRITAGDAGPSLTVQPNNPPTKGGHHVQ
jgi:hypothetical protein